MSITLHDQFRRLRQGVVEAVNAQAGLTARPAGVEAPGISSIAVPDAARHTAWVGRAPKRFTHSQRFSGNYG